MNRVTHFEIHADNTERAIKFYVSVFGWEFTKWEQSPTEYYLIKTGVDAPGTAWTGINGGLLKRDIPVTENAGFTAFVCTMDVANIDEMIKKVEENGGRLAREKVEIPQMGWLCYCKDTEGNCFGMMQAATPAAEPTV
jgi:uncharacterized protein